MERSAWPRLARRVYWAIIVLPALAAFAGGEPANAADGGAFDRTGTYAGVFAGSGRTYNEVTDTDGFSYSGRAGHSVDYEEGGFVGGVLIGRRFEVGGLPLRFEVDGAFGGMSAKTTRIDPRFQPPDETVESDFRWVATARVGVEQAIGPATMFVSAGPALARIESSLTDLDAYRDQDGEWVLLPNGKAAQRKDPDDSFHDASTELGWVIGAGVEGPVGNAWTLRFEGSYLDLGETVHYANRSGDDRCCGAGTPRRPVSYRIENRLGIVRLGLIRRFGR